MLREEEEKKRKIDLIPNEIHAIFLGWNHRLHTQMVEKAGFFFGQVQEPSDSQGMNRFEFRLLLLW